MRNLGLILCFCKNLVGKCGFEMDFCRKKHKNY